MLVAGLEAVVATAGEVARAALRTVLVPEEVCEPREDAPASSRLTPYLLLAELQQWRSCSCTAKSAPQKRSTSSKHSPNSPSSELPVIVAELQSTTALEADKAAAAAALTIQSFTRGRCGRDIAACRQWVDHHVALGEYEEAAELGWGGAYPSLPTKQDLEPTYSTERPTPLDMSLSPRDARIDRSLPPSPTVLAPPSPTDICTTSEVLERSPVRTATAAIPVGGVRRCLQQAKTVGDLRPECARPTALPCVSRACSMDAMETYIVTGTPVDPVTSPVKARLAQAQQHRAFEMAARMGAGGHPSTN